MTQKILIAQQSFPYLLTLSLQMQRTVMRNECTPNAFRISTVCLQTRTLTPRKNFYQPKTYQTENTLYHLM